MFSISSNKKHLLQKIIYFSQICKKKKLIYIISPFLL